MVEKLEGWFRWIFRPGACMAEDLGGGWVAVYFGTVCDWGIPGRVMFEGGAVWGYGGGPFFRALDECVLHTVDLLSFGVWQWKACKWTFCIRKRRRASRARCQQQSAGAGVTAAAQQSAAR